MGHTFYGTSQGFTCPGREVCEEEDIRSRIEVVSTVKYMDYKYQNISNAFSVSWTDFQTFEEKTGKGAFFKSSRGDLACNKMIQLN